MSEYFEADEVKQIAEPIIDDHHPHLRTTRIEYVFVLPTPKNKGKDIWGRARRISGLSAWLSTDSTFRGSEPDPYFVIEISKDIWRFLEKEQKEALVDHELAHCGWDDERESITTVAHDVEEFVSIVERHGLWHRDVERLVEAAKEKEAAPLLSNQMDSAASAN